MSSSESKQFEQAKTLDELEALRVALLGRKSELNTEFAKLTTLPIDQRSQAGKLLNQRRGELESAYNEALKRLQQQARQAELDANPIDISSPVASGYGHGHPVLQVVDEFLDIFTAMGYEIADGPEVEDEWHNFEALNIPGDHPARDMQDTFYLEGGNVPRTHTSNMQIRYMENHQPPIRIVSPGKVYRNEDEDARHAWMFHQVEGLVVDKGISLGDLKGTLLTMIQGIVGDEIEIRLRPNYFPYTEPSVETRRCRRHTTDTPHARPGAVSRPSQQSFERVKIGRAHV